MPESDPARGPARRPTLPDVARAAGVSLKTASRVVNGEANVSPQLAERVRQVAESLGYRHNRMAALLRSGRSGMISLIIRDLTNSFYSSIAAGAESVAERHQSLLVISSHEARPERQQPLLEVMLDHRADGIILTPADGEDPLLRAEIARGVPIVAIDVVPAGIEVDSVAFDNRGAARDAMQEAVRMGATRVAMIFDSYELKTMALRRDGAMEALAEQGLSVRPELIRSGAHTSAEAYAIAAELLADPEPPDAIFCGNNVVAIGVAGLVKGAQVTLISFDDFPLSTVLEAPVVIVDHDAREIGVTAAALLFERIADPARPPRHIISPTIVKSRGSGDSGFSTVAVTGQSAD